MPRIFITDHVAISSRQRTKEGYLVAPAVLSKSGVFSYRASELKLNDRPPDQVVRCYRPFAVVGESAPSFEGVALTMSYPPDGVTAKTWKRHAVGDVHKVTLAGNEMRATVMVCDEAAISAIERGKRHLSCGYSFELVPGAGKTDSGEDYEFQQDKIQGNHVAIVDTPRCGPTCAIGDSDDSDADSISQGRKKMDLIIDNAIYRTDDAV